MAGPKTPDNAKKSPAVKSLEREKRKQKQDAKLERRAEEARQRAAEESGNASPPPDAESQSDGSP